MTKMSSSNNTEAIGTWLEEILFFAGDDFFSDLLNEVDAAKNSVCMESYIFAADALGRRVESHLIAASRRGVNVRLLVDGIGANGWIERRNPELEKSGVQIRIYHPLRWSPFLTRLMAALGLKRDASRATRAINRLNRRNHRKVCLIDEKLGWVGSVNVTASHSRQHAGPAAWRDTAIRLQGPALSDLEAAFEFAWARSHTTKGKRKWSETLLHPPPRASRVSPLVRLNHTLTLRRRTFRDFVRRIENATSRVWITNAYLAPSKTVVHVLQEAARRGVDVRLLVPRDSDVFFMPWVARAHYGPLLSAGVRIFEYLPRFLHAKSVIIDDWATVGTSNMNRRSFLRDFEVDVVLSNPERRAQLEAQYVADLAHASEIREGEGTIRAWLGRMIGTWLKNWL